MGVRGTCLIISVPWYLNKCFSVLHMNDDTWYHWKLVLVVLEILNDGKRQEKLVHKTFPGNPSVLIKLLSVCRRAFLRTLPENLPQNFSES